MEQKCTIEKLIKILNKITVCLGFGRITQMTLRPSDRYKLAYTSELHRII